MWGRNVYDSIRKFLQFQLTVNIVAVSIAFIGAVSDGESPLSAVQMLWVNLIMDTLAALALATETPTPALLDRPPHGRFASLITPSMWRNIAGQTVYQLLVLLVLLYAYPQLGFIFPRTTPEHIKPPLDVEFIKHTIIFNSFVMCQIFNEINCRRLGNELNVFSRFFSNRVFIGVLVITCVIQFLIIEFAGSFVQVTSLNWQEWLVCVLIGAISLPVGFVLRFVPVPAEKIAEPEPSTPLLPEDRTLSVVASKWRLAKKILIQIQVVRAFRRSHRRH